MANPLLVSLSKDVWTKVATAVTRGQVSIIGNQPQQILTTYRLTGGPAPITQSEGVAMSRKSVQIFSKDPIDVYVLPQGNASKVRVEV